MITFHRILFAIMLCAAFLQGAVDAGRRDLLNEYMNMKLLQMSLYQLGQVKVL